jgi:hypothetical protein
MTAVLPAKTDAAAMTDSFWESVVMRLRSSSVPSPITVSSPTGPSRYASSIRSAERARTAKNRSDLRRTRMLGVVRNVLPTKESWSSGAGCDDPGGSFDGGGAAVRDEGGAVRDGVRVGPVRPGKPDSDEYDE